MSNLDFVFSLLGLALGVAISPLFARWGWRAGTLLKNGAPLPFWDDEFKAG